MNTDTNHDRSRVVRVATAPNEALAGFWRSVLEEEGIVVALKAGGAGFAMGTNALNEHHILVREDQAEQARALLAELEADDAAEFDYESEDDPEAADASRDS